MPRNPVVSGRMTADIDGEFVVFLIGMRINKPWKVHKWWPVFVAMGTVPPRQAGALITVDATTPPERQQAGRRGPKLKPIPSSHETSMMSVPDVIALTSCSVTNISGRSVPAWSTEQ